MESWKPKKTYVHPRKGGAPKESATEFNLGDVREGTDGRLYRVIKIGKSQRWMVVSKR